MESWYDGYMTPKKPKVLYSYNTHHELEKHKLGADCMPVQIRQEPFGTYWRCRDKGHDFYGWESLKAAKVQEIAATRTAIFELKKHLEELTKTMQITLLIGDEVHSGVHD